MKKSFWYFVGCLILLLAGGGWWFLTTAGESEKPVISAGEDVAVIGLQKVLTIAFSDQGRGLSHTEITITQDNRPRIISSLAYPEKGIRQKTLSVTVDAAALKLQDGPATLTLTAVDHSLWKNQNTVTLPVTIDLLPPQVFQLNPINHINPGGACIVTYRLSEPAVLTGVQAGDVFHPGCPVTLSGKSSYVAYFALPMEAVKGSPPLRILARDRAGNETVSAVPALILKRKFRSDKMGLSDNFLGQKMPEFQAANPALRGKTPLETFIHVNTVMREENAAMIQDVCRQSEARQLWQGAFGRMKNAAPMALFGDRRTYIYDGKVVGESVHAGVDLASLAKVPIEAANSGVVRFAGPLGIYGSTVIIDHGQGLATLYAHLSSVNVNPGRTVNKGEVIGVSGESGLAGGDHLHFSVMINGRFVDPREWWDPHWIEDNVTKKIDVSF